MSKPKQIVEAVSNKLHNLIVASYKSCLSAEAAGASEYQAFAAVVKAIPLDNAKTVENACADLKNTYGETHASAAQIRINIVNNARKVTFGGMKDKQQVRGLGMAKMLEVLGSVASIRDLKAAMAEAKPDALKGESGGTRKASGRKAKGSLITVPKVATRADAFAAACKVLEFVRDKFLKPVTDAERIELCDKAIALFAPKS